MIKINKISKNYHLDKVIVSALQNINLDIDDGSFLCIAGPSGSGKTTLLNILGLIDVPTEGAIYFDDENIFSYSEKKRNIYRNSMVGIIFQTFNLINALNIYENIHLPLLLQKDLSKKEKDKRVREMIEAVQMSDHMRHRPFELSGGQRQRVAIARALVCHPKLVIADEPTANLDSKTGTSILSLMEEINTKRKTTFVFSTHDKAIMEKAHKIVQLHDGKII